MDVEIEIDVIKKLYASLDSIDRMAIIEFAEEYEKMPLDKRFAMIESLGQEINKAIASGLQKNIENKCPVCGNSYNLT
jgi:hypothetical protein